MGIDNLIRKIANDNVVVQSFTGTVKSVDKDNATCTVTPSNGGADRELVRLRSIIQDDDVSGVVIFPEVNSKVICGVLQNNANAVYVIGYSAVDEVRLRGDEFGGIVKVSELVSKLNAVIQKVNDLESNLASHVHSGVTTGGGSSAAQVPILVPTPLQETQVSDFENDKVKHA